MNTICGTVNPNEEFDVNGKKVSKEELEEMKQNSNIRLKEVAPNILKTAKIQALHWCCGMPFVSPCRKALFCWKASSR